MAMGTRKSREKQEDLWVAHTDLAVAPRHLFYQRLNELLDSAGFDGFVENAVRKVLCRALREAIADSGDLFPARC